MIRSSPEVQLSRRDLDEMLASTEEVFSDLRGARILLTGGTGFFGVWLLAALAQASRAAKIKIPVTLLTRDADSARRRLGPLLRDAHAELLAGDIKTFAFPSGSFTHVIHGATSASAALNEQEPQKMFDIIVDGTRRLLACASPVGAKRILYVSSGAVYGRQPPTVLHVPEEYEGGPSTLDTRSAYAEGKRTGELLTTFWAQRERTEVVSARAFAFVGPHLPLDAHFAIGNFIRDAIVGGPVRVLGDGTPYRSYMYGTDLATWLWTLLARGRPGTAYNVGSDDGRSLRAVAERIAAISGVPVHVAKEATPESLASPERYVPSVARARRELGLEVRVGLDEAIRRTLDFHRT